MFELERGALYEYELSSSGYTLSTSEGLKRSPDTASGDEEQPEWIRELMLSQPNRYRELTRINAKLERRRQFAAAIQRSEAGHIHDNAMLCAYVSYIVHDGGGPLENDFFEDDWWDALGGSVALAQDSETSEHSSDDDTGYDKYIRTLQKERVTFAR